MNDTDRRPTLWMFILVLLGLYAMPRGPSDSTDASKAGGKPSDPARAMPAASPISPGASESIERLLRDYFSLDSRAGAVEPSAPSPGPRSIDKILGSEVPRAKIPPIRCLVGTLADPIGTTSDYHFDEGLTAILRGVEAQSYVLDRYRLPWQRYVATSQPGSPSSSSGRLATPNPGEPGLLICRFTPEDPGGKMAPLLLIFLVPESPTSGLDKGALAASLDWAEALDDHKRVPAGDRPESYRPFNILGPAYTGSQDSLERGLQDWTRRRRLAHPLPSIATTAGTISEIINHATKRLRRVSKDVMARRSLIDLPDRNRPAFKSAIKIVLRAMSQLDGVFPEILAQLGRVAPRPYFEVVSGSASGISKQSLIDKLKDSSALIRYRTTIHSQDAVERAMFKFLNAYDDAGPHIALLYESNTGYGQIAKDVNGKRGKKDKNVSDHTNIHRYPFPQNISTIRSLYERQGANRGASQFLPPSERLVPGSDHAKFPLDLIAPQTPEFTTPVDELVIDEILLDISRRNIQTVGIAATDVRDLIFLAGKIRQMIPDARIFTTENDLVFTHPERISDLRGMFVASTYPLLPSNQSWSYPYSGERSRVFFPSGDAQGIYNATVLQLHDLIGNRADADIPFVEYGRPFALRCGQERQGTCPPIWISVVGNHGIYPIHVELDSSPKHPECDGAREKCNNNTLYKHSCTINKPVCCKPKIPKLYYPIFRQGWLALFLGLSAVCTVLVGIAFIQVAWARRLRGGDPKLKLSKWPQSLKRLAIFLNWAPAKGSTSQGRFQGPGGYLACSLLYIGIIYFFTSYPVLRLAWIAVPWDYSSLYFWLFLISAAILIALLLGAIAAFLVWIDKAGREASTRPAPKAKPSYVLALDYHGPLASLYQLRIWIRRHAEVLFTGMLVAVGVAIIAVGSQLEGIPLPDVDLQSDQVDPILTLYRANSLPSGVSPVFSLLFLAIAGLGWAWSRLYSRFVLEQATPPGPKHVNYPTDSKARDYWAWSDAFKDRLAFERTMGAPWRELIERYPIFPILVIAFDAILLFVPMFRRVQFRSVDQSWITICLTILYAVVFVGLTLHCLQVILIWVRMSRLLQRIARLPLLGAMDRLPQTVVRWMYQIPKPDGGRFEMIWRQAMALKVRSDDSIFKELVSSGIKIGSDEWDELLKNLDELQPSLKGDPLKHLRPILLEHWRRQPVASMFVGSTKSSGGQGEGNRDNSAGDASSKKPTAEEKRKAKLDEWIKQAEDLVALVTLRWLAASLSQIWLMIAYLVGGTICALLAVSSYPFPSQGRLLGGMAALIVFMVLTIITIVLAVNRDEVISRVANTTPHRVTIDQPLMTSLVAYVVPLIGALAVLSVDLSDILRTWLGPILR